MNLSKKFLSLFRYDDLKNDTIASSTAYGHSIDTANAIANSSNANEVFFIL
jgi:hypothetical protein